MIVNIFETFGEDGETEAYIHMKPSDMRYEYHTITFSYSVMDRYELEYVEKDHRWYMVRSTDQWNIITIMKKYLHIDVDGCGRFVDEQDEMIFILKYLPCDKPITIKL
jgi:hypothetical protein